MKYHMLEEGINATSNRKTTKLKYHTIRLMMITRGGHASRGIEEQTHASLLDSPHRHMYVSVMAVMAPLYDKW